MKKSILGMGLALILALTTVFPAFAEEVTVSGVVSGLDPVACTFTLTTETLEVYAVTPPAGFDCSGLADGATVDVTGDSDGEGNLAATSVTLVEEDGETTITGTIESIDYETCTFVVQTETGPVTVVLPEGSDCSALMVGDNVEVTGTLNEDGTFSASGVVVVTEEEEEGVNTGFHCSNPEEQHPALAMLAEAYGAEYSTLLNWFCQGGLGVGGIMLALRTAEMTGGSAEEIIAMRQEGGGGWGQIWQSLGLIGPNRGEDEGEEGEETELEAAGENGGPGNGNGGKPPWAGGGKPPWAGGGRP